jgi:hypothetical protein
MKPGSRTLILFAFPVVAVIAMAAVSFSIHAPKPFAQPRPQFLDYIERLGVSTEKPHESVASERIRNVFSFDPPEKKDDAAAMAQPTPMPAPVDPQATPDPKPAEHDPVWVSMIVDDGSDSFTVINGQKMRIGERSGSFTLTAVRKGSVTIRHNDGIEETIHVKAF